MPHLPSIFQGTALSLVTRDPAAFLTVLTSLLELVYIAIIENEEPDEYDEWGDEGERIEPEEKARRAWQVAQALRTPGAGDAIVRGIILKVGSEEVSLQALHQVAAVLRAILVVDSTLMSTALQNVITSPEFVVIRGQRVTDAQAQAFALALQQMPPQPVPQILATLKQFVSALGRQPV
jgi:hypothetical protein